ncbi:MAG: hypothetical protein NDI84_00180 [Steroidobacteraceae bacterium]|nr:hypothetical protein [Steroidobacteraceae bacterium]
MTDRRRGDERMGDPAVDAAWRRASDEAPPTRVDDAILAAARAAVRAKPPMRLVPRRTSWWIRWQPLAAAAGVVGLAFVLVQLMPRQEATRSPAAVPAPEGPATYAVQESAAVPETAAAKAAPEAEVPAPQARSPAPPAASARRDAAESRAALSGVAAPQAARSVAGPVSPEDWARRVAELHAKGDIAAAATELRAFRRGFSDADDYLPPPLRPWAASVPGADSP